MTLKKKCWMINYGVFNILSVKSIRQSEINRTIMQSKWHIPDAWCYLIIFLSIEYFQYNKIRECLYCCWWCWCCCCWWCWWFCCLLLSGKFLLGIFDLLDLCKFGLPLKHGKQIYMLEISCELNYSRYNTFSVNTDHFWYLRLHLRISMYICLSQI